MESPAPAADVGDLNVMGAPVHCMGPLDAEHCLSSLGQRAISIELNDIRLPDTWTCLLCTYSNSSRKKKCEMCNAAHNARSDRINSMSLTKTMQLQTAALTPEVPPTKRRPFTLKKQTNSRKKLLPAGIRPLVSRRQMKNPLAFETPLLDTDAAPPTGHSRLLDGLPVEQNDPEFFAPPPAFHFDLFFPEGAPINSSTNSQHIPGWTQGCLKKQRRKKSKEVRTRVNFSSASKVVDAEKLVEVDNIYEAAAAHYYKNCARKVTAVAKGRKKTAPPSDETEPSSQNLDAASAVVDPDQTETVNFNSKRKRRSRAVPADGHQALLTLPVVQPQWPLCWSSLSPEDSFQFSDGITSPSSGSYSGSVDPYSFESSEGLGLMDTTRPVSQRVKRNDNVTARPKRRPARQDVYDVFNEALDGIDPGIFGEYAQQNETLAVERKSRKILKRVVGHSRRRKRGNGWGRSVVELSKSSGRAGVENSRIKREVEGKAASVPRKLLIERPAQPRVRPEAHVFEKFLIAHDGVELEFEEMVFSDFESSENEEEL